METSLELQAAQERDVYAAVLRLARAPEPEPALRAVLEAAVQLANGARGYIEIYTGASGKERRWSLSVGCTDSEEEEIRAVTSRGIVAAAMLEKKTVHTPHALLDARFASSKSVHEQRLEAVLCIPLEGRELGVLYLEGKRGQGEFPEQVRRTLEEVASFLVPAAEHLASRHSAASDPTQPFRKRLSLESIVGRSAAMAQVFEHVVLVAPLDVTVLILGPSGTGKTEVARAIHANGPRKGKPFMDINCATLPEGILESELFGTLPGAFSGATRKEGKVKAAEGGTLFLDEVGEIPLTAQAKLLQLLQSKQYYAVGGTKQETADIRLIAATHVDLEKKVAERTFREDLYYRLNVISVRVPALSERREDIGPIVDGLIERIAAKHRLPRLPPSVAFRVYCETADWSGNNVRQLQNAVEGAMIRAAGEHAAQIEPRHLFGTGDAVASQPLSFHEATRRFQRELLSRELEAVDWNVSEVAKRLDLARSHVYNLMSLFDLSRRHKGDANV
jgi:Nif-specific regulatory protein